MDAQELARFYHASDVFILTSNFEGMPMCVLESLACGTPVVTTDVGEVRLIVKPGLSGEIAFSFEPNSIADEIVKVLSNNACYVPENIRREVESFTAPKCLKPLYDKIEELSKGR
jgi:glycosyltransferase involved in cell wall biosynthesis